MAMPDDGDVSEMLLDVPDVLLGCPSVEFNNTSRPLPKHPQNQTNVKLDGSSSDDRRSDGWVNPSSTFDLAAERVDEGSTNTRIALRVYCSLCE